MSADAPGKQELDPELFKHAELVVVDSKSQCMDHGEIKAAYDLGLIDDSDLIELGEVVAEPARGRSSDDQITIADLTGVAVQDIQIAKAVMQTLSA